VGITGESYVGAYCEALIGTGHCNDSYSGVDRGGSEEPIAQHPVRTQAYWEYVEESDAAIAQHPVRTTKVYA
jgi:hypothetical protein